ncbi:pilin [Patescibacteria group bacterium]|nr:pilin [Patescibacteria group bacterium]
MKSIKNTIFLLVALLPLAVSASDYAAQTGLEEAANASNLIKGVSPQQMIARIINALLSLLGMLFTVLIIWGGFKWMTSQGNSQQVDEAKSIIKNSVIGLVIVVMAYAIASFVLRALADNAGTGTGGGEATG